MAGRGMLRACAVQLKPFQALLYLLRQTCPVARIGPGAEQAQGVG